MRRALRITTIVWAAALALPAVGCRRSKTVYFVPIGKFASVPVDELARHYRDRFGIAVEDLPLLAVDPQTYDASRDQLIAEELIAQMRRRYPAQSGDPGAVLVGLTDGDIFIRAKKCSSPSAGARVIASAWSPRHA